MARSGYDTTNTPRAPTDRVPTRNGPATPRAQTPQSGESSGMNMSDTTPHAAFPTGNGNQQASIDAAGSRDVARGTGMNDRPYSTDHRWGALVASRFQELAREVEARESQAQDASSNGYHVRPPGTAVSPSFNTAQAAPRTGGVPYNGVAAGMHVSFTNPMPGHLYDGTPDEPVHHRAPPPTRANSPQPRSETSAQGNNFALRGSMTPADGSNGAGSYAPSSPARSYVSSEGYYSDHE